MIRSFIVFFGIVLVTSCSKSINVPKKVIQPQQMQDIFWDMIRGDILAQEIVNKDSTKNFKIESFIISEKIRAIHNIDREKFKKSIEFYEKHPELIKTIFDSMNAVQTRKNFSQSENQRSGPRKFKTHPSKLKK